MYIKHKDIKIIVKKKDLKRDITINHNIKQLDMTSIKINK